MGEIRGAIEPLKRLIGALPGLGVDALAVVGDLGQPWTQPETYRTIFKTLAEARCPAYWVPGPDDAPLRSYLREAYNLEIVFPFLHGVHGTVALAGSQLLFSGMGGEIVDDPDTVRAEEALLRYPGWEVEYRLKTLRDFDEYQKVLLFTTPPAHKGLGEPGSDVVAHLVKTYDARLAIVAGDNPRQERLGRTLVVCPSRLDHGDFALVDFDELAVEAATMPGGEGGVRMSD
jgi:Icc-related predicted phosphoesterase